MFVEQRADTRPASLAPVLLTAIALGLVPRLAVDLGHGLWEDEILATTQAVQPWWRILVTIVRFDIHPPLYFSQLHLWGLVSHGDLWFVANSVMWSLLAVLSLWAVLRRDQDSDLALTGAAFLAALPAGVWMAREVRPYAWLSVLIIWAFHFAIHCFAAPRPATRHRVALAGLALAIVYSHAIGFLAVLFNGLYAIGLLARRRAPLGDYFPWLAIYGLVALAAAPILFGNMLHDPNLGAVETVASALPWLWNVVVVDAGGAGVWACGLVLYGTVLACGLALPRTRLLTACLLAAPMLVAIAVSLTVKPIFKANFFATMLAPFLALVLAKLALALRPPWRRPVTAALLAGLLALSAVTWWTKEQSTDYPAVARAIRAGMRPGDVVYVPQTSIFWGMAWYLAGPDWGSPLAIAAAPSRQWQGVYRRLGPALVERLNLMPATQTLTTTDGLPIVVGDDTAGLAQTAKRVWLVTYPRVDLPPGLPPATLGSLKAGPEASFLRLRVTLYQ